MLPVIISFNLSVSSSAPLLLQEKGQGVEVPLIKKESGA